MIKLSDIMYLGRSYQDNDESKIIHIWWYSLKDESIISLDVLLKEFGYNNEIDIINSGLFIPLFQIDMYSLEYSFITSMNDKRLLKIYNCLKKSDTKESYDLRFMKLIDEDQMLKQQWFEYEEKHLRKAAEEWCEENHITYLK